MLVTSLKNATKNKLKHNIIYILCTWWKSYEATFFFRSFEVQTKHETAPRYG